MPPTSCNIAILASVVKICRGSATPTPRAYPSLHRCNRAWGDPLQELHKSFRIAIDDYSFTSYKSFH